MSKSSTEFSKLSWLKRATRGTGLSSAEINILVQIYNYTDEFGHDCYASIETLAADGDMSVRHAKSQTTSLIAKGAIEYEGRSRKGTKTYRLSRNFPAHRISEPTSEVHSGAPREVHSSAPAEVHSSALNQIPDQILDQIPSTGSPGGELHTPRTTFSETYRDPVPGVFDLERTDMPNPLPRGWQPNRGNWAAIHLLHKAGCEVDVDCAFVAFDYWARGAFKTRESTNWGAILTSVIRVCAGVDPTDDPHMRAGWSMSEDFGDGVEVREVYEDQCARKRRGQFRPLPTPEAVTTR